MSHSIFDIKMYTYIQAYVFVIICFDVFFFILHVCVSCFCLCVKIKTSRSRQTSSRGNRAKTRPNHCRQGFQKVGAKIWLLGKNSKVKSDEFCEFRSMSYWKQAQATWIWVKRNGEKIYIKKRNSHCAVYWYLLVNH